MLKFWGVTALILFCVWMVLVALTVSAVLFAAVFWGAAHAQTIGGYVDGHSENHDYYKNWSQPGIFPPVSCCHVRQVYGTTIAGDCYPTEFKLTPKGWIAKLRPEDQIRMGQIWIEIPDSKRVREINPDETGRDGHLCLSPSTNQVLCWIPPTGAM